ncbi:MULTISPECIES: hypothetical protein [unclassified Nostoc]|uniref:hypothetical protein n=1 Tax=unclassified Nostoc TaxID=2593658 RepID=UPI002AD3F088|nr:MULTISPECIES: hypothetical protein [unclassified Nostoc]MDZ8032490.1 hypothetical protein [Nostoc sp. DedSLP04]MDZ8093195.1 hypothetical protein [Nostoc sp. DedQUE05]
MLHNNQLDTLTQKSFRFKRILVRAIAGVTVLPSIILDVSVTTLALLVHKISLEVIKLIIPHPVEMSALNYNISAIVTDICVFSIVLNPRKEI